MIAKEEDPTALDFARSLRFEKDGPMLVGGVGGSKLLVLDVGVEDGIDVCPHNFPKSSLKRLSSPVISTRIIVISLRLGVFPNREADPAGFLDDWKSHDLGIVVFGPPLSELG